MGEEEIENFPLREIKSFLKRYFSPHLVCKVIFFINFAAPIFLSSKAKNSRLISEMGVLV